MSLWAPHPSTVKRFPQSGVTDLAVIERPTGNVGRFAMEPAQKFVLTGFDMIFGDTADADAAAGGGLLTLYRHNSEQGDLEGLGASSTELVKNVFWIQEWGDAGITRNRLSFTARPERFLANLLFFPGDHALFNWTNPETDGTLTWSIDVYLAPVPVGTRVP